jgi:hypothetical protein
VVALLALVFAIGGSAIATVGGDFSRSGDGLVQACVAQRDIVNAVTDPVVNSVTALTGGALNSITSTVTPKGTLIVVAPGETCPPNTAPQSLSSTAPRVSQTARSEAAVPIGTTKREAVSMTLPAGTYDVTATVQVNGGAEASPVAREVKCAYIDDAGNTIPGTTSSATLPADTPNARAALPMQASVSNPNGGEIAVACKSPQPAVTGAAHGTSHGARAAQATRPTVQAGMFCCCRQLTPSDEEDDTSGPRSLPGG